MKTLILYASKYGATERAAGLLAGKIEGPVDLVNLKRGAPDALEGYDRVVVGTSVYAGRIHKELVAFVAEHEETLSKKQVAFFVCCAAEEKFEDYLRTHFPENLLDRALFVRYFGHEEVLKEMGFLDRTIFKKVAKVKTDTHDLRQGAVADAADLLNQRPS